MNLLQNRNRYRDVENKQMGKEGYIRSLRLVDTNYYI